MNRRGHVPGDVGFQPHWSPVRGAVMLIAVGLFCPAARPTAAESSPTEVSRAQALLEQGKPDEALNLLAAFPADTTDAEVHRLLGEAYFQLGSWSEAREHLRAALRLDEIAEDHVRLGEVYMRERKFALALAQFRDAWRLGVTDGELHYRLAAAYLGLGRIFGDVSKVPAPGGSAGQRIDDVLLIEPVGDGSGTFWAATSDSAAYQVARALEQGVDSIAVRLLEARIWLAGRQYARALACFQRLEDALPASGLDADEQARFYADFAEACYRADDLEGYLRHLQRAYAGNREALSGIMNAAHARVAERYADRGELGLCISHLEKAVAEAPRDADLRYRLGSRYWEAGQPLNAAREWRIVLQLVPGHPERERILERLQLISAEYGIPQS